MYWVCLDMPFIIANIVTTHMKPFQEHETQALDTVLVSVIQAGCVSKTAHALSALEILTTIAYSEPSQRR